MILSHTMHRQPLSLHVSHIVGVCSDEPTSWAIGAGWTCPTYVTRGLDMDQYCTQDSWISNGNCGKTCAKFGILNDPDCAGK